MSCGVGFPEENERKALDVAGYSTNDATEHSPGSGRKTYLDRVVIGSGGRVVFFRVDELDWVEARGTGAEEYLHRETMAHLEAALDPPGLRASIVRRSSAWSASKNFIASRR